MLRRLCLVAVVGALIPAAWSEIRIFCTGPMFDSSGVVRPWNALTPSFGQGLDAATETADGDPVEPALQVATFPTYNGIAPPVHGGDLVYVWLQFYSTGSIDSPTTNGKLESITLSVEGDLTDIAWYRVDNTNYDSRLRWEGPATPPDYPEFSNAVNQTLSAVGAFGIRNYSSFNPAQLWSGGSNNGTSGRIALLGAFKPIECAPLGYYGITATDVVYRKADGTVISPPTTCLGYHVIPEPAGALLLGLAGPLMRRR